MRMLRIIVASTLLLLPASPKGVQALQRLMDVQQIPTDTLRDVALVTYQRGRPVIYYNPILLQRVGPQLSARSSPTNTVTSTGVTPAARCSTTASSARCGSDRSWTPIVTRRPCWRSTIAMPWTPRCASSPVWGH